MIEEMTGNRTPSVSVDSMDTASAKYHEPIVFGLCDH